MLQVWHGGVQRLITAGGAKQKKITYFRLEHILKIEEPGTLPVWLSDVGVAITEEKAK